MGHFTFAQGTVLAYSNISTTGVVGNIADAWARTYNVRAILLSSYMDKERTHHLANHSRG